MNYWISMALSILFELLKNDPATAKKFKAGLIKLAKAVDLTFPGEVCEHE